MNLNTKMISYINLVFIIVQPRPAIEPLLLKRALKVTGNALNIEYYFWWRDDCFGLLIHHDAPFHFMVSISDEYKYKRLVKTTFKSCGKPIFLEIYHTRN